MKNRNRPKRLTKGISVTLFVVDYRKDLPDGEQEAQVAGVFFEFNKACEVAQDLAIQLKKTVFLSKCNVNNIRTNQQPEREFRP